MNRREFLMSTFIGVAGLSHVSRVVSQTKTVAPNLGALVDEKRLKLSNREVTRLVDVYDTYRAANCHCDVTAKPPAGHDGPSRRL